MIYMRGLKAKDLTAIVDFIYLGEANIYQEDLDSFLVLAEELQLKGLAESQDNKDSNDSKEQMDTKQRVRQKSSVKNLTNKEHTVVEDWNDKYISPFDNNSIVPVEREVFSVNSDIEDIKAKINSLTEKTIEGVYRCTVCGKTRRDKTDIGRHIETHIEGVSYPCNMCNKVSRSSHALNCHISTYHRK
jgi:hypothetical protein